MKARLPGNHGRASSENIPPKSKLSKKPVRSDSTRSTNSARSPTGLCEIKPSSSLRVTPTGRFRDPKVQSSPSTPTRTAAPTLSLQQRYEHILNVSHRDEKDVRVSLDQLRKLIFMEGLPEVVKPPSDIHSIRSRVWKRLLALYYVSTDEYITLLKQGREEGVREERINIIYKKIRNDTFRTLATDKEFKERVSEDRLIRVLNAFVWKAEFSSNFQSSDKEAPKFAYVQGMNVLVAPFLYTMSNEVDAFFAFSTFIRYNCPMYVQPCLEGVHCGLKLVDLCLQASDPELFGYLKEKNLTAELYAFPSVLTFSACTPPLNQVLKLWDFFLAFGFHLNILCVVAQLWLIRKDVLTLSSPMKLLRTFPPLDAPAIIRRAKSLVHLLPDELYDSLVRHPFDPSIVHKLDVQLGTTNGEKDYSAAFSKYRWDLENSLYP